MFMADVSIRVEGALGSVTVLFAAGGRNWHGVRLAGASFVRSKYSIRSSLLQCGISETTANAGE
jgi:hypothetical protein